jgi:hypothetical protein
VPWWSAFVDGDGRTAGVVLDAQLVVLARRDLGVAVAANGSNGDVGERGLAGDPATVGGGSPSEAPLRAGGWGKSRSAHRDRAIEASVT